MPIPKPHSLVVSPIPTPGRAWVHVWEYDVLEQFTVAHAEELLEELRVAALQPLQTDRAATVGQATHFLHIWDSAAGPGRYGYPPAR